MSELMHAAAVNLHMIAPGKFELGVNGDTDIEDAARAVLNTFMDWLVEPDVEVELGVELMRAQRPLIDDLTAARAQVREVVDVLKGVLERDVGRFY
jgi:hypothetical protein